MAESETLGQRLQRLRLTAGLTQEELAGKVGLPVWSLRNWEHDHRLPGLVAVYKLAKALSVPMEELALCAVAQQSKGSRKRRRKTTKRTRRKSAGAPRRPRTPAPTEPGVPE